MHSRLPRGVRPRLEGKPRIPVSSRVATRVSWSPLSGLKGVQPPLPFGERTRDCSPGHAGKRRPSAREDGGVSGVSSSCGARGGFLPRHDEDLRDDHLTHFSFSFISSHLEINLWFYSTLQFSLVAQLCPILCSPMDCSTPGFPVYHQLPELAQTQVH